MFEGLPDIPISRFELKFVQDRLVVTTRELCEPPPALFSTDFTGHNGARRSGQVEAEIAGCAPEAEVKLAKSRSKHPRMTAVVKGGGSALRKAKLKLPRQLRFGKKKALRRGAKAKADGERLRKSALRATRRRLTINSKRGAQKLKLRVRKRGLRRVKKINRGKALRFPVTVVDAGGFKTKLKPRAEAR